MIAMCIVAIAVCYVAQYHAVDEYFPDYMVGLMAVLLLINILIVFYVEALRENELEKFKVILCRWPALVHLSGHTRLCRQDQS